MNLHDICHISLCLDFQNCDFLIFGDYLKFG